MKSEQRYGSDASAMDIYEELTIEGLQKAADILRPRYESSDRNDGYVSMDVCPYVAHDRQATVAEAVRLWRRLQRDNVMISVPATPEGIPAIRELIGRGINVNVTLVSSRVVRRKANEAYMDGLAILAARGDDLHEVSSVASMSVGPLDALVDPMLEAREWLGELVGHVAISNAKLAVQDWKELHQSDRWLALAARGARPQRLSCANTSDDGLEENIEEAKQICATLALAGISIDDLAAQLLDEGVAKLTTSFEKLLASIEAKRARAHALHSAA